MAINCSDVLIFCCDDFALLLVFVSVEAQFGDKALCDRTNPSSNSVCLGLFPTPSLANAPVWNLPSNKDYYGVEAGHFSSRDFMLIPVDVLILFQAHNEKSILPSRKLSIENALL